MDDELLDLVNKNDEVIGQINRMDHQRMVAENLGYMRAVDLFIVNTKGQVFVPVRTAHKTIAPNGFDYSAGGHVGAGETYARALITETKEELKLDIGEDMVECIAKTVNNEIRYIRSLYVLRSDETPNINREDFVGAEWLHPDTIIKKLSDGHPAKVGFREAVELLEDYLTSGAQ